MDRGGSARQGQVPHASGRIIAEGSLDSMRDGVLLPILLESIKMNVSLLFKGV
jgi:hypothetical protein